MLILLISNLYWSDKDLLFKISDIYEKICEKIIVAI